MKKLLFIGMAFLLGGVMPLEAGKKSKPTNNTTKKNIQVNPSKEEQEAEECHCALQVGIEKQEKWRITYYLSLDNELFANISSQVIHRQTQTTINGRSFSTYLLYEYYIEQKNKIMSKKHYDELIMRLDNCFAMVNGIHGDKPKKAWRQQKFLLGVCEEYYVQGERKISGAITSDTMIQGNELKGVLKNLLAKKAEHSTNNLVTQPKNPVKKKRISSAQKEKTENNEQPVQSQIVNDSQLVQENKSDSVSTSIPQEQPVVAQINPIEQENQISFGQKKEIEIVEQLIQPNELPQENDNNAASIQREPTVKLPTESGYQSPSININNEIKKQKEEELPIEQKNISIAEKNGEIFQVDSHYTIKVTMVNDTIAIMIYRDNEKKPFICMLDKYENLKDFLNRLSQRDKFCELKESLPTATCSIEVHKCASKSEFDDSPLIISSIGNNDPIDLLSVAIPKRLAPSHKLEYLVTLASLQHTISLNNAKTKNNAEAKAKAKASLQRVIDYASYCNNIKSEKSSLKNPFVILSMFAASYLIGKVIYTTGKIYTSAVAPTFLSAAWHAIRQW